MPYKEFEKKGRNEGKWEKRTFSLERGGELNISK